MEDPEADDGIEIFEESTENCKFDVATAYVASHTSDLAEDQLLLLYGLYKMATVGPCDTEKPSLLNFAARKKWHAWNVLGCEMDRDEAKAKYAEKVAEWCGPEATAITSRTSSGQRPKGHGMGVAVSRPRVPDADECEASQDDETTVFDWVKCGDLESLKTYKGDPNLADDEGLSLLHWAVDRGHLHVVKYLIESIGADPDHPDGDGDGPLSYAVTCGLQDIVSYLLQTRKVDPNRKNASGESPAEIASESVEMQEIFEEFHKVHPAS